MWPRFVCEKTKGSGDVHAMCQADDLGLPSLQQIIAEAEKKAASPEGFVKMTLSPRGLQVGFPLLEAQTIKRSASAPSWARPVSKTDVGRTTSIGRTSAMLGVTPRASKLQPTESVSSPSRSRSPRENSPPASPRSPSAYMSPRCVCSRSVS